MADQTEKRKKPLRALNPHTNPVVRAGNSSENRRPGEQHAFPTPYRREPGDKPPPMNGPRGAPLRAVGAEPALKPVSDRGPVITAKTHRFAPEGAGQAYLKRKAAEEQARKEQSDQANTHIASAGGGAALVRAAELARTTPAGKAVRAASAPVRGLARLATSPRLLGPAAMFYTENLGDGTLTEEQRSGSFNADPSTVPEYARGERVQSLETAPAQPTPSAQTPSAQTPQRGLRADTPYEDRISARADRMEHRGLSALNPMDYRDASRMMRSDTAPRDDYTTPMQGAQGMYRTVVGQDGRDEYGRAIYSDSAFGATRQGFDRGIDYSRVPVEEPLTGTVNTMNGGQVRVLNERGRLAMKEASQRLQNEDNALQRRHDERIAQIEARGDTAEAIRKGGKYADDRHNAFFTAARARYGDDEKGREHAVRSSNILGFTGQEGVAKYAPVVDDIMGALNANNTLGEHFTDLFGGKYEPKPQHTANFLGLLAQLSKHHHEGGDNRKFEYKPTGNSDPIRININNMTGGDFVKVDALLEELQPQYDDYLLATGRA